MKLFALLNYHLPERNLTMFEKFKEDRANKKAEKKKRKLEAAEQKALKEREAIEAEQAKIQAEKERLLGLKDNELMVELILSIRGFYNQFKELAERQDELADEIRGIQEDIASLEADIGSIESRLNSDD